MIWAKEILESKEINFFNTFKKIKMKENNKSNKFFKFVGSLVAHLLALSFLLSVGGFAVWFCYSVFCKWLPW